MTNTFPAAAPLEPAEIAGEIPEAIIDGGIPGQWSAVVDHLRLIPLLWRRTKAILVGLQLLRTRVDEHQGEIVAIEQVLGVNPQGSKATVASRLAAIEARLSLLEGQR